jgi:hypothetical protein
VAYYDAASGELHYATNAGGAWVVETVDTGNVGEYPSLSADEAGVVYIVYYDVANKDLKYARKVSGEWEKFTLDAVGDVGKSTSLVWDSASSLHVVYTGEGAVWRMVIEE